MKNRKNIRLKNWDYSTPADYFITICTHDRQHFFGEIISGKMNLSKMGVIAYVLWFELKNHFNNIDLDEFVVMPNHIHGMITIIDFDTIKHQETGHDDDDDDVGKGHDNDVGKGHALSLRGPREPRKNREQKNDGKNRFQNIGNHSISSMIGSYKSAVTKYAHRLNIDFQWQTRFYDHIIRDAGNYNRIKKYIKNNPVNWKEDRFYNSSN